MPAPSRDPSLQQLRLFAIVQLLPAAYFGQRLLHAEHHVWAGGLVALSALLGVAGTWNPRSIRGLYCGWMRLLSPVGWMVSTLVLLAIYGLVVTPIGWLLRRRGHDPLGLCSSSKPASYWRRRPEPPAADRYFREF